MYPGAGSMTGMPPTGPGQHGMGPQSPMNSPMQQQRRIDPDQMPSPVSAMTSPACTGQAFSQMDVQASCGQLLIKENPFIFHMLP